MQVRKFLCVCAAILLCFSASHLVVAGTRCSRHILAALKPQWISTVELNEKTKEILIADPKSGELFAYDPARRTMGTVPFPEGITPSSITKVHGGFLVTSGDEGVVIGFDKKVRTGTFGIGMVKEGGRTLDYLYSNWVTRGSTFVGFGMVLHSDLTQRLRNFQLGFVRGKVDAASGGFRNIELLQPVTEKNDNDWYLIGFPYFAANNDGFFFVRMTGKQASIMRVNNKVLEELPVFPERYRDVPRLKTPNKGPSSTADRFREIEGLRMAVGLFGQGKMLYLLTREPNPVGSGTQWLLHRIDSRNKRLDGVVRLPTTSNHLTVVPGGQGPSEYWYLLERGPVEGWGQQDNSKIVLVPSDWITAPKYPRLALNRHDVTCQTVVAGLVQ